MLYTCMTSTVEPMLCQSAEHWFKVFAYGRLFYPFGVLLALLRQRHGIRCTRKGVYNYDEGKGRGGPLVFVVRIGPPTLP